MTDPENREPTTTDAIRSDIEQARAELSDTVDQLAEKLDVKAQVGTRAEAVKDAVAASATEVKAAAPQPVQDALDRAGEKLGPAAHQVNVRTRPHRREIAAGAAAALVAFVLLRRSRRRGQS